MAKWFIDSRTGDDSFPGRLRNDRAPGDIGFVDDDFANVLAFALTATASLTTTTNLQDLSSPFTVGADVVNRYVRLIDSGLVARVMKITARIDDQNVTVAAAHFGTPSTGAVTAYWVGGAKRSLSTASIGFSTGVDPNLGAASGDTVFLTGYFSGEAKIAFGNLELIFRGYRRPYCKATSGNETIASQAGGLSHNCKVYDIDFESSTTFAITHNTSGGGGGASTVEVTGCKDHGGAGLVQIGTNGGATMTMRINSNWAKTKVLDKTIANGFSIIAVYEYLNNTNVEWNSGVLIPTDNTGTAALSASNNLCRATAVRATPFIRSSNAATDYNTFDAPATSKIVHDGTTEFDTTTFSTYEGTHPNSKLRTIDFLDADDGLGIVPTTSAEVGSANGGGVRGALDAGVGISKPFVIDTAGAANSWGNISNANIMNDELHINTVSGTAEAIFPYQGHAAPLAGPPAIARRTTGDLTGAAGNATSWDLGVANKLKSVLSNFSGIVASGASFSIFDGDGADGAATLRIRGWSDAAWTAGAAPTFDSSLVRHNDTMDSNPIVRYLVINIYGLAE